MPGPKPRDIDERFWEKVEKTDTCWNWTSAADGDGYGMFQVSGRVTRRAHRWIYEREVGPIPDGLKVCHRCDNPACVNYTRCLFVGSTQDNNTDRNNKGRHAHGERHYAAKLTETQVIDIRRRRANGETRRSLSEAFGVSLSGIDGIVSRRKWKHVGGTV